MGALKGKKIILGISASIAAYKAAFLVRGLIKKGAEVQVVMTKASTELVSPLTLSTLAKRPVIIDFVNAKDQTWNEHVHLGLWADAMVIAPISCNTLGKLANGLCPDFLSAVYLSAKCPIFFAPAMDLDMHEHPATQANIKRLQSFGNHLIPSQIGELASGLTGPGRMEEPAQIVSILESFFKSSQDFSGKKILVTAGPTHEALDPVRFIGNRSSGKMGFALAACFANRGAKVFLVTGPTKLSIYHPNIELIPITSAAEMYDACHKVFSDCEVSVMAAAVADYTPATFSNQKIKKKDGDLSIPLMRTKDIAASLGKIKKKNQLLIGFALETQNEIANAERKLKKKNFDLICLNSLNDKGAGFGHDTNKMTLIDRDNNITKLKLSSKDVIAQQIADAIISF